MRPPHELRPRVAARFIVLAYLAVLAPTHVAGGGMPATFIFGDSLVDAGNNNYIASLSKANYPPNGIDFLGHQPTGRYTNGRTIVDILGGRRTQSLCLSFTVTCIALRTCVASPPEFFFLFYVCFQRRRWGWEGSSRRTWPRRPRATP